MCSRHGAQWVGPMEMVKLKLIRKNLKPQHISMPAIFYLTPSGHQPRANLKSSGSDQDMIQGNKKVFLYIIDGKGKRKKMKLLPKPRHKNALLNVN